MIQRHINRNDDNLKNNLLLRENCPNVYCFFLLNATVMHIVLNEKTCLQKLEKSAKINLKALGINAVSKEDFLQ